MQKLRYLVLAALLAPTIAYGAGQPKVQALQKEQPSRQEISSKTKGIKALEDYITAYKKDLEKGNPRTFHTLFDGIVKIDLENKVSGHDIPGLKTASDPVLEYQTALNEALAARGLYLLFKSINTRDQITDSKTLGDVFLFKISYHQETLVNGKKGHVYFVSGFSHPDISIQGNTIVKNNAFQQTFYNPKTNEFFVMENYLTRGNNFNPQNKSINMQGI
jgi:hypothetical protein